MPQLICVPQPSPWRPQLKPCIKQVRAVQVPPPPQTPGTPPPPQV